MASSNAEIASLLYELARLTALDEGSPQSFRARAYEGAARTVEGLGQDAADMSETALTTLRGVGKSTARKIREYVETGAITKLEELRERFPPGYLELTRIPGLGPKTIELLRSELGVQNVEDLRTAIESEALRDLPGLGAKTEENLARAIELLGVGGKERRTPILEAMRVALDIVEALRALPRVEAAEYTGSLRRFRETIGDVDIVVVTAGPPEPVMERFVELPIVRQVIAHGDKKSSVLTPQGLQVDLRVVTPEQAGAALLYFTGSKAHNIRLRQVAIDRGWTLNEYGLTDVETGQVVASATEEEIYRALGLDYVPPPLREDTGEIEAAARGELPDLVTVDDIRGDLHVHTSLSGDGRDSLEKMVAAAAERGYLYLAVTEHAENLTINGISREQMLRQRRRLGRLRAQYPEMTLLHGAELNIGYQGDLDYDEEFLATFDWCVASVHSHFRLDGRKETARVIAAIRHPAVNAVGHLTGRRIGRRPGIELDLDAVLDAAAETGTAIEINSHLDRLDASAEVLRRARDRGVVFVINTDAHNTGELAQLRWGVLNAQRGWVERDMVANAWERDRFLEWVSRKRKG